MSTPHPWETSFSRAATAATLSPYLSDMGERVTRTHWSDAGDRLHRCSVLGKQTFCYTDTASSRKSDCKSQLNYYSQHVNRCIYNISYLDVINTWDGCAVSYEAKKTSTNSLQIQCEPARACKLHSALKSYQHWCTANIQCLFVDCCEIILCSNGSTSVRRNICRLGLLPKPASISAHP